MTAPTPGSDGLDPFTAADLANLATSGKRLYVTELRGRRVDDDVDFSDFVFEEPVSFANTCFAGAAMFRGARFMAGADFSNVSVHGQTDFSGAVFEADASFDRATFDFGGYDWFDESGLTPTGSLDEQLIAERREERNARRGKSWRPVSTPDVLGNRGAWFDRAVFKGTASFYRACFEWEAGFDRARFEVADFGEARFHGAAWFRGAVFTERASFNDAKFVDVWFDGASFKTAEFENARIAGSAWFEEAQFTKSIRLRSARIGSAWFPRARFKWARLEDLDVEGVASFEGAHFEGGTVFDSSRFVRGLWLDGAALDRAQGVQLTVGRQKLPSEALEFEADSAPGTTSPAADAAAKERRQEQVLYGVPTLRMADTAFDGSLTIEAKCDHRFTVVCSGTGFHGGTNMEFNGGEISLDGALFGRASTIRQTGSRGACLVSLNRADVENLTLSSISLETCRFAGAYNLDKLRIEGQDVFATPPRKLGQGAVSTTAGRRIVLDEHIWRATQRGRFEARWRRSLESLPVLHVVDGASSSMTSPATVADIYRALRKGREDSGDSPGAADFYYGEMEMRRLTRPQGNFVSKQIRNLERLILWAYWVVSGYALRASRATLGFVLVVALGAVAIGECGFKGSEDPSRSDLIVLAVHACLPFGPTAEEQKLLNDFGQVVALPLRLVGPALLALAILSIRGRVKR